MTPVPEQQDPDIRYRVDQFADAPWPSEAAIEAEAARERFNRSWSKFDLSDCNHGLAMQIEAAGWSMDLCVRCGHVDNVCCTHPAGFEWNDAGTLLRCRTCGKDGT